MAQHWTNNKQKRYQPNFYHFNISLQRAARTISFFVNVIIKILHPVSIIPVATFAIHCIYYHKKHLVSQIFFLPMNLFFLLKHGVFAINTTPIQSIFFVCPMMYHGDMVTGIITPANIVKTAIVVARQE